MRSIRLLTPILLACSSLVVASCGASRKPRSVQGAEAEPPRRPSQLDPTRQLVVADRVVHEDHRVAADGTSDVIQLAPSCPALGPSAPPATYAIDVQSPATLLLDVHDEDTDWTVALRAEGATPECLGLGSRVTIVRELAVGRYDLFVYEGAGHHGHWPSALVSVPVNLYLVPARDYAPEVSAWTAERLARLRGLRPVGRPRAVPAGGPLRIAIPARRCFAAFLRPHDPTSHVPWTIRWRGNEGGPRPTEFEWSIETPVEELGWQVAALDEGPICQPAPVQLEIEIQPAFEGAPPPAIDVQLYQGPFDPASVEPADGHEVRDRCLSCIREYRRCVANRHGETVCNDDFERCLDPGGTEPPVRERQCREWMPRR